MVELNIERMGGFEEGAAVFGEVGWRGQVIWAGKAGALRVFRGFAGGEGGADDCWEMTGEEWLAGW